MKEKEKKAAQQHAIKEGSTNSETVLNLFKPKITISPGFDQFLSVNQHLRVTPKRWWNDMERNI